MNSTSIKIKKFFSNRNTVAIICAILIIIVIYVGYTIKVQKAIEPVVIPYAKVTIQPRTKITEEMIGYMTVAQAAVDDMGDNLIKNKKELIDYYSNVNTMIPKGSLFYKSAVVEKDKIAGSALFDLKDDEVLHYLSVNMSTSYVNSIVPGGYIDLYVRETDEETGKARVGKFIRNIKVLAVKTSDGLNVFENSDEQRVPSYVLFAATPEEHQYLVTAAELGITVFPVPTSVTDEKVIAEEETQGGKVDRFTSFDIQTYIEDKSERFEQIIQGGGTVTPEPDNNTGNNGEQNDQTNGG